MDASGLDSTPGSHADSTNRTVVSAVRLRRGQARRWSVEPTSGFAHVRRLPSKQWQASYQGPDLGRHAAPHTFVVRGDAEGWLAAERALISGIGTKTFS